MAFKCLDLWAAGVCENTGPKAQKMRTIKVTGRFDLEELKISELVNAVIARCERNSAPSIATKIIKLNPEEISQFNQALKCALNELQFQVISIQFGLLNLEGRATYRKVGSILNLSSDKVCRISKRALRAVYKLKETNQLIGRIFE